MGTSNEIEQDLAARIRGWKRSPPPIPFGAVDRPDERASELGCLLALLTLSSSVSLAFATRRPEVVGIGALVLAVGLIAHRLSRVLPRIRRRHAIGLRAVLLARGGVVCRRTLRIPPRKLEALIEELALLEKGEFLVDPTCLERPLAETVAQVERRLQRVGSLSPEATRRLRDDLPRAYALASLEARGVVARTEDGGVVFRRGLYRD